jgi:hypothetical protein
MMQLPNPAWWPSKLEAFRKCFYYGKLKHIDQVLSEEAGLDTEFGQAMHLGINDILLGGNGQDIFDMYFASAKGKPLKRYKYGWEALNEMAPVFFRKFVKLHAKKFRPFLMEDRLFGTLDDELLEGTPDFLGHYEEIPSIVDFKTSAQKYLKEALEAHHQPPFYAYLSQQQYDFTPEQKVLYVFVKDRNDPSIQVLKDTLTSTKVSSTMVNVKAEIRLYKDRSEYPKNYSACVKGPIVCSAFHLCHGVKNGEQ